MKNRVLSGILAGFVFLAALSMAGCGNNNTTTSTPPQPPGPKFDYPSSVVAISVSGTETDLYVADTKNHTIRKVVIDTSSGPEVVTVSTFAGMAGVSGYWDGTGAAARFYYPCSITTDGAGNLYVADTYSNTIRQIVISTQAVTTLAGKAGQLVRWKDETGDLARFYRPFGITYYAGKLYVADTGNHVIREVDVTSTVVTTLAGTKQVAGFANNTIGTSAMFRSPIGVATDGVYIYVGDTDNHTIRKVDLSGTHEVSTIAGGEDPKAFGYTEDIGTAARFYKPAGLALSGTNLFVADSYNHVIRVVDLTVANYGKVSYVAGDPTVFYHTDDPTDYDTRFRFPQAITTLDGATFYVADTYGHILRKLVLSPTFGLSIQAGLPLVAGHEDSP